MLSTCKGGLGPTNKQKPGLDLLELGGHMFYMARDVVAVCGKQFLHEVGDWLGGERVCVSHYMKDNVHERLEIHCPTGKTTCLLFENGFQYNLKRVFKLFGVLMSSEGALITSG